MPLPPRFHFREGTSADTTAITDLYLASFDREPLLDIMFPSRREHPVALRALLRRHFHTRYWSPGWKLTLLVDDTLNVPVGFTWWLRPATQLSFRERWLSIYAWLAPVMRAYISLRAFFSRRTISTDAFGMFSRMMHTLEQQVLNTPARREAWYLSTIGVHPVYQGQKLGKALLQEGLEEVDRAGKASYLIGLRSVEEFYPKYGFKEVFRVNQGELKHWDGGSVMFRE